MLTKPHSYFELSLSNKYIRDFLLKKFNKYLDVYNSNILEIGIGHGRFGFLLGEYFEHYYGIDVEQNLIDVSKKNIPENANVTYCVGRAEKIPFKFSFDIIFYTYSWHLVKDFENALSETKRVLNPNGIVAILEPSEHTTSWNSASLRRDSHEFQQKVYDKKMHAIKRAKKEILEQKIFEIIENEYEHRTTFNFYVLKNKDNI